MANMFVYLGYYMIMKFKSGERPVYQTWIYAGNTHHRDKVCNIILAKLVLRSVPAQLCSSSYTRRKIVSFLHQSPGTSTKLACFWNTLMGKFSHARGNKLK
jgi:hypothetical protein